jgi:hypothetical protein
VTRKYLSEYEMAWYKKILIFFRFINIYRCLNDWNVEFFIIQCCLLHCLNWSSSHQYLIICTWLKTHKGIFIRIYRVIKENDNLGSRKQIFAIFFLQFLFEILLICNVKTVFTDRNILLSGKCLEPRFRRKQLPSS